MRRYFFRTIFIAMKFINLILAVLLSLGALAQVQDNFDDGDFINSPAWAGNTDSFVVFSGQLRLNALGAGKSYLSTSTNYNLNHEWRLTSRFDFSPSNQNFCRVYLVSSQSDLSSALNGYYVQLGGSTGNTDSISLYRQDGLQRTRLIAGRAGTVSKSQNAVSLRVVKDSLDGWQLFSDTTGGINFSLEGSATDSVYKTFEYAGVYCQYTSGNKTNFYFDNFYSGPIIIDQTAPLVDSFAVLSSTSLLLRFNEAIDLTSSQTVSNYILNGGIQPVSVVRQSDERTVLITFSIPFVSGQSRTLVCDGVEDLAGNPIVNYVKQFFYFVPTYRDIVINEIFPDPSPVVGLPVFEFVELYNRSATDINIKGWYFSDGTTTATLPDFILKTDSHLTICPTGGVADYSILGRVLGVTSFPSLNNAGDKLVLMSASGNIIDEVNYSDVWYGDELKRGGGWTLEQKNPNHPCSGSGNWIASSDISGGTPGKRNSVYTIVADNTPPSVINKLYQSGNGFLLVFDEQIDSVSFSMSIFTLDNGVTVLSKVLKGDSVFLQLSANLVSNVTYTFRISGVKDCWGNVLNNFSFNYVHVVPVAASIYGVLITEILADENPVVGLPEAEYIELYNNTGESVDLTNWSISDISGSGKLPSYILDSGEYVILCNNSAVAKFSGYSNVLGVSSFPSLSNDGELLVLKNSNGNTIHFLNYNSSWHTDNLKKNGGWSLEMADLKNYCTVDNNWRSSLDVKGGTPGSVNSLNGNYPDTKKPEVINSFIADSVHVVLVFSEAIDSISASKLTQYVCADLPYPVEASAFSSDFTSFKLRYPLPFSTGIIYELSFDSITDCAGNVISAKRNRVKFAVTSEADSGDIIINEVLFNPRSGGYDYVELYNRTNKVIDLNRLMLANVDNQHQIKDFYGIGNTPLLIFPKEQIALTENVKNIRANYYSAYPERILQVNALPGMSDDEGTILIMDSVGKRLDQLNYSVEWHHPQVDNKDGVSLERISYELPTQDKNNWTSAAATAGYGTPGQVNSQFNTLNSNDRTIHLLKDVFSPDGDGYDDELLIQYNMGEAGYICTFSVLTSQGDLVKKVLNNELLGASGQLKWRGETAQSAISPPGIYVLVFELQHPSGQLKQIRKTAVLAVK